MQNKIIVISLLIFLFISVANVSAQPGLENFRWVGNTGLALSGQPSSSDWETLAGWGIDATVNLRCIPDVGSDMQDNETYLGSLGIEYYWLPITGDIDIAWNITEEQVNDAICWINQRLEEGKNVLIHCAWGQARSPTLAMMWYVQEEHTPEEAFIWIHQFPEAYPVEIQKQAVRDYYNWLPAHNLDSTPPNILKLSQSPPESYVLLQDEVKVNATVIDGASGVKQVTLNYTNVDGTWFNVEMTNLDGNHWNGIIPAFPYGTSVTYIILAEDNAGNNITSEELGYQCQYQVIPEFPSWIILPLFLATTLFVVVFRNRFFRKRSEECAVPFFRFAFCARVHINPFS